MAERNDFTYLYSNRYTQQSIKFLDAIIWNEIPNKIRHLAFKNLNKVTTSPYIIPE